MTKVSATLAFLCCLITVAAARSLPETDASDLRIELPTTEGNLQLPSKTGPESDSSAAAISMPIIEAKPAEVRDLSIKTVEGKSESDSDSNTILFTALPLTRSTFRPVNRRFPVRKGFPYRHHIKIDRINEEAKEMPYGNDMLVVPEERSYGNDALVASREDVQVPYGNDMILPIREDLDPEPLDEMHRFHDRWVRLHHHRLHHHHHDEDSDDDENDMIKTTVFNKRYNHGRFDREKRLRKMRKQFLDRIEEEKQKKSGFMGGVRRFLDNYF